MNDFRGNVIEHDEKAILDVSEEDNMNLTNHSLLFPSTNRNNPSQVLPPSVYSWGRDDLGGLFHNPTDISKDGVYLYQNKNTFIAISSNIYHSAALTSTGEIYTTGDNLEGQVKEYTQDEQSVSTKPRMLESLINHRISSVVCGLNHTVCVTSSGCALSFGGNECGQLGHSISKISHVTPKVPLFQLSLRAAPIVIKKVSCGDLFTLFLTTAGEVYGCGSSLYLGNATTTTTIDSKGGSSIVQSSHNICPAQRIEALVSVHVKDIASGSSHSLALSTSSTGGGEDQLYGWGSNAQYQLGQPQVSTTNNNSYSTTTTDIHHHPIHEQHQQIPIRITISSHSQTTQYGRIIGLCAGFQHSIIWTDKGFVMVL